MEETKKQLRKQYAKRGERTSKMMSFRADGDVVAILDGVTNKGRLLNDLVLSWSRGIRYNGTEEPPKDWFEEYKID